MTLERQTDRWSYRIDDSHAPAYVIFQMQGFMDKDLLVEVTPLLEEALSTGGGSLAPLIFDTRSTQMGTASLNDIRKVQTPFMKRLSLLVNVMDTDEPNFAQRVFPNLAARLIATFHIADSIEEAKQLIEAEG